MKKVTASNHELSLNQTQVKIEECNEKMTSVHITTEDADIYVNGVLIWQKFDDPEYANVPPVLRNFVKEHANYIKTDGKSGEVTTDLYTKGFKTGATLYIPKNLRLDIHARMDAFTSIQELEEDYIRNNSDIDEEIEEKLVSEFKAIWNDIEDAVKACGWDLIYSHDMSDKCFGWWDVVFKLDNWNQETFVAMWEKFSNLNKRLDELFDTYKF